MLGHWQGDAFFKDMQFGIFRHAGWRPAAKPSRHSAVGRADRQAAVIRRFSYSNSGARSAEPSPGLTLPATIDSDNIRAEYRDGILSLTLPKSEKAKPKRIQIAATAA